MVAWVAEDSEDKQEQFIWGQARDQARWAQSARP